MNDEVFTSYNVDKMMNKKNAKIYMIEYLNIINFLNLLLYKLKLKIDIIVILLHNLNLSIKLYNEIYFSIIHINISDRSFRLSLILLIYVLLD